MNFSHPRSVIHSLKVPRSCTIFIVWDNKQLTQLVSMQIPLNLSLHLHVANICIPVFLGVCTHFTPFRRWMEKSFAVMTFFQAKRNCVYTKAIGRKKMFNATRYSCFQLCFAAVFKRFCDGFTMLFTQDGCFDDSENNLQRLFLIALEIIGFFEFLLTTKTTKEKKLLKLLQIYNEKNFLTKKFNWK